MNNSADNAFRFSGLLNQIVSQPSDNSRIQCELQAWIYAFSNALTWTATAERIMRRAMDSYGWKQTHKDLWSQITGIPIEEGEIVIAEEVNILQQSISHEKETAKGILAYG